MAGVYGNNARSTELQSEEDLEDNMVWKVGKNTLRFVVRFYVLGIVMAYHWVMKFVYAGLAPLRPIFVQVKKVPKKDVSVQGITYQFFRLQFLVLLYMFPFISALFAIVTEPLKKMLHRLVDWVGLEDEYKTKKIYD